MFIGCIRKRLYVYVSSRMYVQFGITKRRQNFQKFFYCCCFKVVASVFHLFIFPTNNFFLSNMLYTCTRIQNKPKAKICLNKNRIRKHKKDTNHKIIKINMGSSSFELRTTICVFISLKCMMG